MEGGGEYSGPHRKEDALNQDTSLMKMMPTVPAT